MAFRNFVTFDNNNYDYVSGSWTRSLPIRSSMNATQNSPAFQYDGLDKGVHKLTLLMQAQYSNWGVSTNGYSQLSLLTTTLGKKGVSMPVIFVDPVGLTYSVVPMGTLQMGLMRIYGTSTTPVEFEVPINLNET